MYNDMNLPSAVHPEAFICINYFSDIDRLEYQVFIIKFKLSQNSYHIVLKTDYFVGFFFSDWDRVTHAPTPII